MTTPDPNRWGWRDAPARSLAEWPRLVAFAAEARAAGLDQVLVCGMGGSSLAPRVLADSFGAGKLRVLDSTDPGAVRAAERWADPSRTLFVIASKSGTTVESLAALHHFSRRASPDHFAAVTDPGTPLEQRARAEGWRDVFAHPADVGGRYAALTVVGMLPLALIGGPGPALLDRARAVDQSEARELGARAAGDPTGILRLAFPRPIQSLALWVEQLVAESTGKSGRGIVPVVDDGPAPGTADPLDLGREFLRWEHAAVEMCRQLDVDPFDQPDVEAAKVLARAELARPGGAPGDAPRTLTPRELASTARPGDYVAVLAYLPQTPEHDARLAALRRLWRGATGCAVTTGYGPRYLHSTGQLHKGGPDTGRFLVITADPDGDIPIPEMNTTFAQLEHAQAVGDIRALLARERRVAHVHLRNPEDWSALAPA